MAISTKVIVLEDNFDAVRNAVSGDQLMEIAKAGGYVVEGHAKINASKGRPGLRMITGNLVNSINVSDGEKTEDIAYCDIGTNVVYARIHELGGIIMGAFGIPGMAVHMPARPYLRPAMDENEPDIKRAVNAELWRHLDRATR